MINDHNMSCLRINKGNFKSTIYYIGCPEIMRVKIGFTAGAPEKRLRDLQTGSPTRLRLICAHPGDMGDEAYLHDKFSKYRTHGEWFQMNEELYDHMLICAWLSAVDSRAKGRPLKSWQLAALQAMNEQEPLSLDLQDLLGGVQ